MTITTDDLAYGAALVNQLAVEFLRMSPGATVTPSFVATSALELASLIGTGSDEADESQAMAMAAICIRFIAVKRAERVAAASLLNALDPLLLRQLAAGKGKNEA